MSKSDREFRDPARSEEPAASSVWEEEGGAPAQDDQTPDEDAPAPVTGEPEIDYKDRWLRAEAELQTFRRRARRDNEEDRRQAEEAVLLELVGWLDDLERALESAGEGGAPPAWTEGVSLIARRAYEYLARNGVAVVDPVGQPFDPHFQEALLEVEPPPGTKPGTVIQVVHKGYRRGPRALRAARVVVARHHPESAA